MNAARRYNTLVSDRGKVKKQSGDGLGGGVPDYKLYVIPALKGPGQRFIFSNWVAITIGSRIFSWRTLDAAEIAHELVHVRQWQRYGITFIPRYFAASMSASRSGKNRYLDNQYEREAYAAAEEVRKREGVPGS